MKKLLMILFFASTAILFAVGLGYAVAVSVR